MISFCFVALYEFSVFFLVAFCVPLSAFCSYRVVSGLYTLMSSISDVFLLFSVFFAWSR